MTKPHLSYSQLNQLRSCGEQYRLARVEQVPQRPSVPAIAGKVIHTATEAVDIAIHRGCTDPWALAEATKFVTDVAFADEYEAAQKHYPDPDSWKRYGRGTVQKPKGEDIEWFRTVGVPTSVNAYIAWRLATLEDFILAEIPGFGPAIEVPFVYQLNSGPIKGYIDRVFTTRDGGFYPLDIKSGLKPKTDEQLGVYAAALHAALGWRPSWGFYLYGLKKGIAQLTPPISIEHWTNDKISEQYGMARLMIERELFLATPGESCFHCSVSDHCTYLQAAI